MLEYLVAAATVSVGWSGYFASMMSDFGMPLPPALINAPLMITEGNTIEFTGAILNVPAVVLIALLTIFLVLGIRASSWFNNLMVLVKLTVLLLVIGFGMSYIEMDNLDPIIPPNTGTFGEFGWSGILRASGVIFFAYIGFDAVSIAAQEARNPQRDMPIGILGSLAICTVLYMLMSFVITGMAPYETLAVPQPVYVAVEQAGENLAWLLPIISVGATVGLASVVLVLLLGQSRIFYAMSRDGMLPPLFSRIHPRFRTPYLGTIITGICAAVLGGILPLSVLGELVSIGTLAAFIVVCISVIVLRASAPHAHRPFRTPFVPWVPLGGIAVCGTMMAWLPPDTWIRLLVWLFIGLVIYAVYGVRHAKPPAWTIDKNPAE